jgi:membrane protein DedA with SNARE-associated domain
MLGFSHHELYGLVSSYGYWAVLAFVLIESVGIPFPGETMLLAAAIYAGTMHHSGSPQHELNIVLVIVAASCGAIVGDSIGYWLGRQFGYEVLLRYGRYIHFDHRKMKLGQYLFLKHGGKVVFFGRFIAVLRTFAALLAGINCMSWRRFLLFNVTGGIIWATVFGTAGFYFGKSVTRLLSTVGILFLVGSGIAILIGYVFFRRHHARLEAVAELHFPGPLEHHLGKRKR